MEKEKLKWKYDSKFNQWWVGESFPWANDGMKITKLDNDYRPYQLKFEDRSSQFRFWKLKSAKQFAELYKNG